MPDEECKEDNCWCHGPDYFGTGRYLQPNAWGRPRKAKIGWSYRYCPDCGWGAIPVHVGIYPSEGEVEARKKYVQKLIKRNGAGYRLSDLQINIHRKFFCKDKK